MSTFGLALIYLKRALQEEGCPICRCIAEHEERYLRFLLWENVNDIETRTRLMESLGFCRRHAQQMLQMEREELGMVLGNSIIYESLTALVRLKLQDISSYVTERQTEASWQDRLWGGWKREWGHMWQSLAPQKDCRVCELSCDAARHYGEVLLDMLGYETFQELYARSEGVCLPHLRIMLQAAQRQSLGLGYLLRATEERLGRLERNLHELSRKYSAQYRHEPVTEEERLAVERAIAFLTGSDLAYGSQSE